MRKMTRLQSLGTLPSANTVLLELLYRYDAWAQLPAETFYQQFEQYPTSSGVITAAEKQCGPRPIDAPRCTNQPESPLPNDMYGQFTDVMLSRKLLSKYRSSLKRRDARTNIKFTPFETMRPKFINSGSRLRLPVDMTLRFHLLADVSLALFAQP